MSGEANAIPLKLSTLHIWCLTTGGVSCIHVKHDYVLVFLLNVIHESEIEGSC